MKFLKTGAKATALLAAALVLAGCNGNNPFKGGSNPVKEYPSANEGVPYNPGEKQVTEPPPDNSQFECGMGMSVAISNDMSDEADMVAGFTEEKASEITVTVTNKNLDASNTALPFEVSHEGPQGSEFLPVSKDNNQAVYTFKWTPSKIRGSDYATKTLKVLYHYQGGPAKQFCGEVSAAVTLIVGKTTLDPKVSLVNLPATIALGTESVPFQIVIDDPASNQENAPDIKQIGFRNQGSTGRQQILDASAAVKCDEAGQFVEGTQWLFNCTLKLADIKRVSATSTKDQKASFFVIAESKRNTGKTSIAETANFTITAAKAGE